MFEDMEKENAGVQSMYGYLANNMTMWPYVIFLVCLFVYWIFSLFFLAFPGFLHKSRMPTFKAVLISHRGGAGERTENTMTAFRHAIELGKKHSHSSMLEIDIQLTKDGIPVVAHDKDLQRICDLAPGDRKFIREYNFNELPAIRKSLEVEFAKGFVFTNEGKPERIPRLEEVFREFPTVPITMDVKTNDDVLIRETDRLIRKHCRQHLTVWGNENYVVTDKLHKINPSVRLFFPERRLYLMVLLFVVGLLPFWSFKETYIEIPLLHTEIDKSSVRRFIRSSFLKLLFNAILNPFFLMHLRKRKFQIFYWVLNKEKEFRNALDKGADGIMTDFPTRLSDWLKMT